jgi:hypothetical protein
VRRCDGPGMRRQARACGGHEGPTGRGIEASLVCCTVTAVRAGVPRAGVQQTAGIAAAGARQLILVAADFSRL